MATRRIVTGTNQEGRSYFIHDGPTPGQVDFGIATDPKDPAMHITRTIDYAIILSGEIDLELDEGEVHLKQGDVVVQRGTRHAWRNRGTRPCTVAFVLVRSPNYDVGSG